MKDKSIMQFANAKNILFELSIFNVHKPPRGEIRERCENTLCLKTIQSCFLKNRSFGRIKR